MLWEEAGGVLCTGWWEHSWFSLTQVQTHFTQMILMLVKSTLSVPDFSFQLSTCHSYAAFQCSSLHCFNGGLFFCLDATSECGQTGTCIKSRKMGTFTWKVPDEGPSEEGESGLVKEAAVAHGRQKQEGWFCEQTPGLQCQMWLVFVWMSGLNWSAVVPCMTYVSLPETP